MKTTNRTVLDLSKVQHGSFWYVNQYGGMAHKHPLFATVRGRQVDKDFAAYHPDYPGETMYERALRLDIIDNWTAVCTFQLTANHNIQFTGKKAKVMWKAWNERIFNKGFKKRKIQCGT